MKEIKLAYSPRYPEVHEAFEAKRFAVLVAHRRFGKTVLAVNHLIKMAVLCQKQSGHFAYVAPFRNQAKSVAWDYLKFYTACFTKRRINESELSVAIPSKGKGAKIRIFGADNPDALRGLYFDGVVMDEVAQMKPEVWEEIIQPALADRAGFAVFIGTPKGVNLFSRIYHHALANPDTWAALCYPVNTTQALPTKEVERLRKELSENKFRQEMMCDFTASADDILITLDLVQRSFNQNPDPEIARKWPLIVGVDVARYGEDATVFFRRQGNIAYPPVIHRKKSNTDVAHSLIAYIAETKPRYVCIDQGQGTGVIDLVRDNLHSRSCSIIEIPFGSRAINDDKFVNRRAEMWTAIREWLKLGGKLPSFDQAELLKAELTAPCYSFDAAGRIKLEAKDEIKKRLAHSTDIGDALALTFAINTGPEDFKPVVNNKKRRKDYDYNAW